MGSYPLSAAPAACGWMEQRDTGFLCRSVHMASAEEAAGSAPTDTQVGEAVVAYLATGPLGPAGSGRYRVAAVGAQRGS